MFLPRMSYQHALGIASPPGVIDVQRAICTSQPVLMTDGGICRGRRRTIFDQTLSPQVEGWTKPSVSLL